MASTGWKNRRRRKILITRRNAATHLAAAQHLLSYFWSLFGVKFIYDYGLCVAVILSPEPLPVVLAEAQMSLYWLGSKPIQFLLADSELFLSVGLAETKTVYWQGENT
jgi:hypothetical protein